MIMELHGGTLTIESVLGKGTCVTVVFAERSIVYDDGPVIASSYSR
jgi:signal transduction histidine kinase